MRTRARVPGIHSGGVKVRVDHPVDRLTEAVAVAERFGEHLWVVMATYQLSAGAILANVEQGELANLDTENLLNVAGAGCFRCEQMWSRELAQEPCKGEPVA